MAQALARGQGAQGPAAVDPGPRRGEGRVADVGAEDRDAPVGEGGPEKFVDEDSEGVGLRPGGAACAPDPQGAFAGAGRDQRRQDRRAQRGELLGVAEEEGLADGDLGLERRPFGPARHRIVEEVGVGGRVGEPVRPEPFAQAVEQQVVLVGVVVVAGAGDDPRLEGRKAGIGLGSGPGCAAPGGVG